MTPSVGNLSVRRTRKLLRESLIELIEERGFDALTISEITERAMVSRAAFYRHYQDKYDLVEQIFAEAMCTLSSAVDELGPERHPPEVWVRFFEHVADYDRLYRALLGSKGSPWFVRKMRAALAELVKETGHGHVPGKHHTASGPAHTFADDLVPDLVSALFVEVITWWLVHGKPYTPREVATRSSLLAAALFKEVSIWQ